MHSVFQSSAQHDFADFPIKLGSQMTDLGHAHPITYGYQEINQRIDAAAAGLLELGLPANSKIAIIGTCSYDFVTTAFGIYRSRHALVPINYKSPADLIEYYIRDCGAALVFCDAKFQTLVPHGIQSIVFNTSQIQKFLKYTAFDIPTLEKNFVHTIRYTSGTTGKPKGVISTYGNRLWQLHHGYDLQNIKDGKCVRITSSPFHHLAGLNFVELALLRPDFSHTQIILLPTFDTRRYVQTIEEYKVTEIAVVAPMMNMILQEVDLLEQTNLDSVTKITLTSSPATKKLHDDIKVYFKKTHIIINPYGTTELGGAIFGKHPLNIATPPTSVGFPVPGIETRLDDDGVLQVRSPGVTIGYHNNPELSKKSMTEDGFFITGDIFRIGKHGFYFWLGRADDMFKSGGEKIYPSEIESTIERHQSVAMSAVVKVPDPIKGYKPYAFVKLKPGYFTTEQEIKKFVVENVATYQIPRQVWILNDLPKTDIGKIDRIFLSDLAIKNLQSAVDKEMS